MFPRFILAFLLALACSRNGLAQGQIVLANYGLTDASGSYTVPIYVNGSGTGIGEYARTLGTQAWLGLSLHGASGAFAQVPFFTGDAGAYTDSSTFNVPGTGPGGFVSLDVKLWLGDSYENATIRYIWPDVRVGPLGGKVTPTDPPLFPADLSGWESVHRNIGFSLTLPQQPQPGRISLANFGLTGVNGSYNTPVWLDLNGNGTLDVGEGIGAYAAALGNTAHLGLYLRGAATPFATSNFKTGSLGQFTDAAGSTGVPGFLVGDRAPLTVKVWVGTTYETSTLRASWDFTSAPLGDSANPANLSGWGEETAGLGYALPVPPGSDSEGQIILTNSGLTDNQGNYSLPIWVDANGNGVRDANEGIGDYANSVGLPAWLGLSLQGSATLFAKVPFEVSPIAFYTRPGAAVNVPGFPAGSHAPLTVRVWIGDAYETALLKGSWDFTSATLGRTNSAAVPPANLSGWGTEKRNIGYSFTTKASGQISMVNFGLTGTNGGYDVPIWLDLNGNGTLDPGEGIGEFARALQNQAHLGLYLRDGTVPFATTGFNTGLAGAFTDPGAEPAMVPGYGPGERAPLTIKVWMGASYDTSAVRASWDFISLPLGGSTSPDFPPSVPADLSPWGEETQGRGYVLPTPPGPVARPDLMVRRTVGDGVITITTLLSNDSVVEGQTLTFKRVDTVSNNGATIQVSGDTITYHSTTNDAPDFFSYTIANSLNQLAVGRVDVVLNDPEGLIAFDNRHLRRSDTNGFGDVSGFYDVPLWVDLDANGVRGPSEGIFDYATRMGKGATLELSVRGATNAVISRIFTAAGGGLFLGTNGPVRVIVPGKPVGAPVDFTVKAWIGSSYAAATVRGSWDFTSLPLGGSVLDGQSVPIPDMTGWGDQATSAGYSLNVSGRPVANPDTFAVEFGDDLTIPFSTLVSNDTDPAHGIVTIWGFDLATSLGGSIRTNAGTVIVHPAGIGPETFKYRIISSQSVLVGEGLVTLNVAPARGQIKFTNKGLRKASGTGTYDAPIWVDFDFDGAMSVVEGFGRYAKEQLSTTAKVAIYAEGGTNALYTGSFQDATGSTNSGFFQLTNSQPALLKIPNTQPGARATLTVKAWVGDAFTNSPVRGSWTFLSDPLGGPRLNQDPVDPPPLSGFGPEDGSGYPLDIGPAPVANVDVIQRQVSQVGSITVATALANDSSDARFLSVDTTSNKGFPVTLIGGSVINYNAIGSNLDDYFYYTVRNALGGRSRGRITVLVEKNVNGLIIFGNASVRKASGQGTYQIPVWVDSNFNGVQDPGEGFGAFALSDFGKTATMGLFVRDASTPLATAIFSTDTTGAFLKTPALQTVAVTNFPPGTNAPLTVKVWVGTNYDSAILKESFDFTSLPLGGLRVDGVSFPLPDVTGLGTEDGLGLKVVPGVKPIALGTAVTRLPGQDYKVKIAEMIANDSDPEGGTLTVSQIDTISNARATIVTQGGWVYYLHAANADVPDFFEYTVRNAKGGRARGRVDFLMGNSNSAVSTRLNIERITEGAFVTFRGIPGRIYTVQYRDGLDQPWRDLGTAVHLGVGLFGVVDWLGGETRFYRIVARL